MLSKSYQVQVHIIEARDLKGRDSNGLSDPVCIVDVAGKKKNTSVFKRSTSCVWDHLFFFEVDLDETQFDQTKISIGVYDANTFTRNELIGRYDFDIAYVYGQPGHELFRRWVVLTDTARFAANIQGFLKLSLIVLGPGESPVVHSKAEEEDEEEEDEATGNLASMVLKPPEIEEMTFMLKVRAFKAEDLPKMDTFGSSDPYLYCLFAGNKAKTDVKKNNLKPIWNQELRLPVRSPCLSDRIELSVYDWDKAGSDELIGASFFRFTDIRLEELSPRWVNLYGPPLDRSVGDQIVNITKKKDIEPSSYRGRMLISMLAENAEAEDAMMSVSTISPCAEPVNDIYVLRVDLYEGTEFSVPTPHNVVVEFTIGPHIVASASLPIKKGGAAWYAQLKDLEITYPKDITQVPNIIVNVYFVNAVNDRSRVGYLIYNPSEVKGFENHPQWSMLNADRNSAAHSNRQVPGFLLFSLNFGLKSAAPTFRRPMEKYELVPYQIRAHIYQARHLMAADQTGTSDPYTQVAVGPRSMRTKKKDKTLYPIWYESIVLDVDLPKNLDLAPNIIVQVFDWNQLGSDELLGRFEFKTSRCAKRWPGDPKWFPIYITDPKVTQGEILASFEIYSMADGKRIPVPNIQPPMKDCMLEVSLVGLRNLLPIDLLPVRSPFVLFETGAQEETNVKRIKTKSCSEPSGQNPNFLEVYQLPVQLPLNPLFCPFVNMRVYDERMGFEVLSGSASIDLAPFLPWSKMKIPSDTLPLAIDNIPGARPDSKGFEEEAEEDEEEATDAVKVEIPEDIEDVNQECGEVFNFVKDGQPKATRPDVKENHIGAEDEDGATKADSRVSTKHEYELDLKKLPFYEYNLYKGSSRTTSFGLFQTSTRVTGKVKANFRIIEKAQLDKVLAEAPAPNMKELFKPKNYVVRAYVLRGRYIVPKDMNGKSDPYLIAQIGAGKSKRVEDRRMNARLETLAPDFYEVFEMPAVLPGPDSELRLSVYDKDLTSDEKIGDTVVDLENRLFSEEWKETAIKPKEYRTLWVPSSSHPQGKVEMWVEILTPEEAARTPKMDITPPQPRDFECRVIVWNTKDVVFKDENMSDIFVRGVPMWLKDQPSQDTDIHWRSLNGEGMFNWRYIFPARFPNKLPRLKIQIWDKDIFNPNDSIAEANLNLRAMFKRAYSKSNRRSSGKNSELIDREWIDMFHPNFEGVQGRVEMSIEIMTAEAALQYPAGKGRGEPNENPHLDEPNRPPTSFAPWRIDRAAADFMRRNKWKFLIPIIIAAIVAVIVLAVYISILSSMTKH